LASKPPKIENGRLVREMPLTEVFSRSVQAGAEGLATDIDYFQALAQTLVGADEAAAENIFQARQNEEYTASLLWRALSPLRSFSISRLLAV